VNTAEKSAAASTTPMVEALGVEKWYGSLQILKGIDLVVRPGEVVCLIGPSGSGKTTFLRCLNHLETIDSGQILIDGDYIGYRRSEDHLQELGPREICKRREQIGMVFQHFNLFPHMTVLENHYRSSNRGDESSR
jgi:polar amino acid transport system ATP-binding protein